MQSNGISSFCELIVEFLFLRMRCVARDSAKRMKVLLLVHCHGSNLFSIHVFLSCVYNTITGPLEQLFFDRLSDSTAFKEKQMVFVNCDDRTKVFDEMRFHRLVINSIYIFVYSAY